MGGLSVRKHSEWGHMGSMHALLVAVSELSQLRATQNDVRPPNRMNTQYTITSHKLSCFGPKLFRYTVHGVHEFEVHSASECAITAAKHQFKVKSSEGTHRQIFGGCITMHLES